MLIAIELVFALITYLVITSKGAKKPSFNVSFLVIALTILLLAGLIMSSIWALLVVLPILAGFGVLIGSVLGASVNFLSSMTVRPSAKGGIWFFGLALLVLASFHSKYRLASEALRACDSTVQSPQEILTVFKGLENQQFNLTLDPEFAWISVYTDHRDSFLRGSSKHSVNLGGDELQRASCDLTRNFSRPILLDTFRHAIRISNETGELLRPNVEQDYLSYNYVSITLTARHRQTKFDQEIVMPNGQALRMIFRARMTRGWLFSTDYHGLVMTFELVGDADEPPIEQASRNVDIFNDLGYLTFVNGAP